MNARRINTMNENSDSPWDTCSLITANMTEDGTLVYECYWDGAEARKQLARFGRTLVEDRLHFLLLQRDSPGESANAIFFRDPKNRQGDFFIEYLFESQAEREKYFPYVRETRDRMAETGREWLDSNSQPHLN